MPDTRVTSLVQPKDVTHHKNAVSSKSTVGSRDKEGCGSGGGDSVVGGLSLFVQRTGPHPG